MELIKTKEYVELEVCTRKDFVIKGKNKQVTECDYEMDCKLNKGYTNYMAEGDVGKNSYVLLKGNRVTERTEDRKHVVYFKKTWKKLARATKGGEIQGKQQDQKRNLEVLGKCGEEALIRRIKY